MTKETGNPGRKPRNPRYKSKSINPAPNTGGDPPPKKLPDSLLPPPISGLPSDDQSPIDPPMSKADQRRAEREAERERRRQEHREAQRYAPLPPEPVMPPGPEPRPEIEALRGRRDAVSMRIKRTTFLAMVAEGHSERYAIEAACISRETIRSWKRDDPDFAQEFADALEDGTDIIEQSLRTDALRPGNFLAKIAILRARRPHLYGDKVHHQHDLTLKPGAELEDKLSKLADRTRAELLRLHEERQKAIAMGHDIEAAPFVPPILDLQALPAPSSALLPADGQQAAPNVSAEAIKAQIAALQERLRGMAGDAG